MLQSYVFVILLYCIIEINDQILSIYLVHVIHQQSNKPCYVYINLEYK